MSNRELGLKQIQAVGEVGEDLFGFLAIDDAKHLWLGILPGDVQTVVWSRLPNPEVPKIENPEHEFNGA